MAKANEVAYPESKIDQALFEARIVHKLAYEVALMRTELYPIAGALRFTPNRDTLISSEDLDRSLALLFASCLYNWDYKKKLDLKKELQISLMVDKIKTGKINDQLTNLVERFPIEIHTIAKNISVEK